MQTLIAFDLGKGESSLVRSPDGLLLTRTDGARETVEDQPLPDLLMAHADALLPEPEDILTIRSDLHSGVELAPMLELALGELITEAEVTINGLGYWRVGVRGEDAAVWVPDDPDKDPAAEIVLAAHWDLLTGTPSPATSNPGTAYVIRFGDVSVLSDPSAELLQAYRGPVIPEEGDTRALVASSQTTHIESSWLEAHPHLIPDLLASDTYAPSWAVYVNGRLWHRAGENWRDTPDAPYEDHCLRRLADGAVPGSIEITGLEGTASQAARLHPIPDGATPAQDAERFVLVPGSDPERPVIMAVAQAALKSTREVRGALICRLQVDEEVRFGVRVAGDAGEVCRGLGLPGWLELHLADDTATGAWVTRSGERRGHWRSTRELSQGFPHPIAPDSDSS